MRTVTIICDVCGTHLKDGEGAVNGKEIVGELHNNIDLVKVCLVVELTTMQGTSEIANPAVCLPCLVKAIENHNERDNNGTI